MFSKFFSGITGCLILANLCASSNGLFPFGGTPGVHGVYRGIWAVFDNPAGLAEEKYFSAGVSYQSRFLMQQLATKALAVVIPAKRAGNFGLGYQQFGYELYRDQRFCATFSRTFGGAVSAAIRLDYLAVRFGDDYGNSGAITGSAGVIAKVTDAIRVGVSVYNPQRAKFSRDGSERNPAIMTAAVSWNFKNETELALGVTKAGNLREILQCALRYEVSPRFLLHAGISNGVESFSFGYAFKIAKLEIGMASGYHQLLGFSPRFSLIFKNK